VREPKDADDVVGERLRAVLAGSPPAGGAEVAGPRVGADRRAAVVAVGSLRDLARVGEPLQWSDIIPAWPEEPTSSSPSPPDAERWLTDGFPAGSAWASPPGAGSERVAVDAEARPGDPAPAVSPGAAALSAGAVPSGAVSSGAARVPGVATPLGDPDTSGYSIEDPPRRLRPPDERRPLAPPAWVLPATEMEPEPVGDVADPLAGLGVSESWMEAGELPSDGLSASGAFGGGREFGDAREFGGGRQFGSGRDLGSGREFGGGRDFGNGRDEGERRMGLRAFDPGRRGVRALAVVAVLVVLVAGFLAWRARPRVDPVAAPPSFDAGSGAGAGDPVGSAASASPSVAAEVVVAVAGKVRKPGLVRLPPGSRVADALTAAGGAEPGVDVSMLNLARKVVDGELILVGITPSPGAGVPVVPPVGGAAATTGGLVDLNTATLADLDTLPGVGPVLAQRILDARTAQGGFKAVSDLRKVSGIGDARYEQLKDLVTV
jgi:competence protein ComEA